jgi:hypothetical protein
VRQQEAQFPLVGTRSQLRRVFQEECEYLDQKPLIGQDKDMFEHGFGKTEVLLTMTSIFFSEILGKKA